MDLVDLLNSRRAVQPCGFREAVVRTLAQHRRRIIELEEALRLIDEIGEARLDRLIALNNDQVAEGPHGSGCECETEGVVN
jgi:hypothetical protein